MIKESELQKTGHPVDKLFLDLCRRVLCPVMRGRALSNPRRTTTSRGVLSPPGRPPVTGRSFSTYSWIRISSRQRELPRSCSSSQGDVRCQPSPLARHTRSTPAWENLALQGALKANVVQA